MRTLELRARPEDIQFLTRRLAQEINQRQLANEVMHQAAQNVRSPLLLPGVGQLRLPSVRRLMLAEHSGLAIANGRLYRVSQSGESVGIQMLAPGPITVPKLAGAIEAAPGPLGLPAGPAPESQPQPASNAMTIPEKPPEPVPAAPFPTPALTGGSSPEGPATAETSLPRIMNFSGQTVSIGGFNVPPSEVVSSADGLVTVTSSATSSILLVADPKTGKPIAGIFEGSAWYSISAEGHFLPLDDEGNLIEGAEPITYEEMEDFLRPPNPAELAGGGPSTPGTGTRVVAGGMAAIQAVNEMLQMVNMVLDSERHNIALQNAAIDFWSNYGGDPDIGMWDRTDYTSWFSHGHEVSPDTQSDTSVLGLETTPYIKDINIAAFRVNFPSLIKDYKEFLLFMDAARQSEALQEDPVMPDSPSAEERATPRRYTALVNWMDPDEKKSYDVTDIVNGVRDRTLAALDTEMRSSLAKLTPEQRSNIFRLKDGSETKLYRAAGGGFFTWHTAERIMSAQVVLGPDPWVRPTGRSENGRSLVTAANADAERSSLISSYLILKDIGDVMDEVVAGGRKVEQRIPPEGSLISFVAGPDPDGVRFGETRYFRQPGNPDATVAIGELRQFWVDNDELEPVDAGQIAAQTAPPAH
jgi:hypothetical protein